MISANENLPLLILYLLDVSKKKISRFFFPPALKIVAFCSLSLFSGCREELSAGSPLSQLALDVDYSEGCERARGRLVREIERGEQQRGRRGKDT